MNKRLILFIPMLILSFPLIAQNYGEANVFDPSAFWETGNSPRMLIHTDSVWRMAFQFNDGTPVSMRELGPLLNTVPENEVLMRQIRRGVVTSNIMFCLMLASFVGMFVFDGANLQGADIAVPVLGGAAMVTALVSIFTGSAANMRLLQAVDNFNMHHLGIPRR